jgi:uncharacterized protein
MSGHDRYIPGVPCWIDTSQPDAGAAREFYGGLFGWDFEEVMPEDVPMEYAIAKLGGEDVAGVGSQPPGGGQGPVVWSSYIWVEDADATAAKVSEAGGNVLMGPDDVMEAGRIAVFTDSQGAVFGVWQAGNRGGAAVVNEHGSLNFNNLSTPDVERAAAFYGAVFGWELLSVAGTPMWALPGYGDFLESRTPGLRARMAEMGAPERFEDVVAGMVPRAPDQAAEPSYWGVTFAVDDADGVATRATELGGTVLVPPFDAPWVRMTVVTDPQGATFTASQFVPENRG